MGLGSVALVSLTEAREMALANRRLAGSGGNPLADKRRAAPSVLRVTSWPSGRRLVVVAGRRRATRVRTGTTTEVSTAAGASVGCTWPS